MSYQLKGTGQVIVAWTCGALTGGLLTPFAAFAAVLVHGPPAFEKFNLKGFAFYAFLEVLFALGAIVVWFVGIAVVGGPIWAALHHFNLRGPKIAVATGALLASLGGAIYWPAWWLMGPAFAACGAAAGWVMWNRAYEKGSDTAESTADSD